MQGWNILYLLYQHPFGTAAHCCSWASAPHPVGSNGSSSTVSVSLVLPQGLPNVLSPSWAPHADLLYELSCFELFHHRDAVEHQAAQGSNEMFLQTSLHFSSLADRPSVIMINILISHLSFFIQRSSPLQLTQGPPASFSSVPPFSA